jgi:hypothetical protein
MLITVGAVYQIICFLSNTACGRILLIVVALWPLLYLITLAALTEQVSLFPGATRVYATSKTKPAPTLRHPVEELIEKARVEFASLVSRQSNTLEDAETEYRRRYAKEPPPRFDKWFTYAQSQRSVVIDDFDTIHENLEPYFQVNPQALDQSIEFIKTITDSALKKCAIAGGKYHCQGGGWIANDLGSLLADVLDGLPDLDFIVNEIDEPVVITTQQKPAESGNSKPRLQDASHRPIWDYVVGPCQNRSTPTRRPIVFDHGIPFVQNWYDAKNICQHPEFEHTHGFFSSPATGLLTDRLMPVLSQAAPTTFRDILFPSPWYTGMVNQPAYKEEDDLPWEQKTDTLYWTGRTTGSWDTAGSWKDSHRQRFVALIHTLGETIYKYMKQVRPGVWDTYKAVEDCHDRFDVKLTAVIQCDEEVCEAEKAALGVSKLEDRNRGFRSRFLFDIDGNSFSARYYTLLQSRSVVLKQTVFREWHDERLAAWIHFIPISMSMEELPEIMRYMTSNDEGRKRAEEIADAGREWHRVALRREDFTIYLYRLLLELARLMDPEREVKRD